MIDHHRRPAANPRPWVLLFVLPALCLLASAGPATAQIPDSFTNLKLLDQDIDQRKIVGIMRDWAGGLGVRCSHCHVGPDNLVGMDFASDEKPTKRTARQMLEMARTINRQHLEALPVVEEGSSHQIVSCYTCHRGEPKPPRSLRVELADTYQQQGIGPTLEHLARLRAEHNNDGRYDLSPRNLAAIGAQLAELNRHDDAVTWFNALLELDSDSSRYHAGLGMVHLQAGRGDQAKAALEKALELDPDNGTAKFGLGRLKQSAPEG